MPLDQNQGAIQDTARAVQGAKRFAAAEIDGKEWQRPLAGMRGIFDELRELYLAPAIRAYSGGGFVLAWAGVSAELGHPNGYMVVQRCLAGECAVTRRYVPKELYATTEPARTARRRPAIPIDPGLSIKDANAQRRREMDYDVRIVADGETKRLDIAIPR